MAVAMSSVCLCASFGHAPQFSPAVSTPGRCNGPANLCVSKVGSGLFGKSVQCESSKQSSSLSGLSARARHRAGFVVRGTIAAEEASAAKADLSKLKADLLAAVAGLDRGLVAEEADQFATNAAAQKLEAVADAVELPEDLDKLDGRWRLVFSSGFNSGSYGGQRPGPSISRSPFILGSNQPAAVDVQYVSGPTGLMNFLKSGVTTVYQRIDVASRELDNIVDLRFPVPWPLPPLEITATLAHSFELAGGSKIRIIFEKTSVKPLGVLSQLPQFELPKLPEFIRPRNGAVGSNTGEFETTYVDNDFRISRGDRGELRIFVKAD